MKAGQRDSGTAGQQSHIGLLRFRPSARPSVRLSAGFTLVEVLVALLVASMMVLLAHGIFSASLDASQRVRAARHSLDRDEGRHRFLTATFLSLEIGSEGAAFDGRPEHLTLSSWLSTGDGWFERREIEFTVNDGRLLATVPPEPALVLVDSLVTGRFDYLLELGAGSRWVGEWVSPVSAPLAVRLRLTRRGRLGQVESDTTVYLIKARG